MGTKYTGGDRLAVSLTHALILCQPSAPARYAACPASQESKLQWHLESIHFDSGTRQLGQLGPRLPPSQPSGRPRALHLHDGKRPDLIPSSHTVRSSPLSGC